MEWVSVKDDLPHVVHTHLLLFSNGEISTGYLSKRTPNIRWTIHDEENQDCEITHWMPLPEPPKDE